DGRRHDAAHHHRERAVEAGGARRHLGAGVESRGRPTPPRPAPQRPGASLRRRHGHRSRGQLDAGGAVVDPVPPSTPGAIVQTILGVQSWQRAFILIVLGLAALLGVIVWQARDRLANALTAFLTDPPTLVLVGADKMHEASEHLVNPFAP